MGEVSLYVKFLFTLYSLQNIHLIYTLYLKGLTMILPILLGYKMLMITAGLYVVDKTIDNTIEKKLQQKQTITKVSA